MSKRFYVAGIVAAIVAVIAAGIAAEQLQPIKLNPPDKTRGLPFMQTLSVKASAREFSQKELSLQDLSDLMWAACGTNRPDENKTTASSAMNAHDVDVYVFMKDGVYLYDAENHALNPVLSGDYRSQLLMARPPRPDSASRSDSAAPPPPPHAESNPPVQIILISDSDRFRRGEENLRYEWGAIDAGIVSQNISLFCAATGLKTRPRASMDKDRIKELLKLKDSQHVFLNHPVGYALEATE